MPRFLIHPEQLEEGRATLSGSQFRHAVRVLRLGLDDEVTLVTGNREYLAAVEQVTRSRLIARVLSERPAETELRVEVTLVQSLTKADRMDWIVQKCTELGTTCLIPVLTERSIIKPDSTSGEARRIRWRRIAESAAQQSGRLAAMEIAPIVDLHDAVQQLGKNHLLIVPYEGEAKVSLREAIMRRIERPVAIIIGPEGGFSADELERIRSAGGITVSLGPRILRTETAAVVSCALVMHELSEIEPR